jgi:hypothetical protein
MPNYSHSDSSGTGPEGQGGSFAVRPPSTAWEQIPVPECPAGFVWAWFKPKPAPSGVFLRLADLPQPSDRPNVAPTLRRLLRAVGIEAMDVALCYLYGIAVDLRTAGGAYLDQPLTEPPQGADPNIVVLMAAPPPSSRQSVGAAPTFLSAGAELAHVYDDIDADWNITLQLEKQLVLVRKQLASMLSRLGTLDRDLTTEERLHGDRQAKTDWQEARRWLKDAAARLARYIKEHDVGETSAAGKRLHLQEAFEQFVARRRPVDNIVQLHREFEAYRKRLQILLNNMNTAYNGAAQDGERRAQEVLRRISASVRNVRAKKRGRTEDFAKLKPRQLDH